MRELVLNNKFSIEYQRNKNRDFALDGNATRWTKLSRILDIELETWRMLIQLSRFRICWRDFAVTTGAVKLVKKQDEKYKSLVKYFLFICRIPDGEKKEDEMRSYPQCRLANGSMSMDQPDSMSLIDLRPESFPPRGLPPKDCETGSKTARISWKKKKIAIGSWKETKSNEEKTTSQWIKKKEKKKDFAKSRLDPSGIRCSITSRRLPLQEQQKNNQRQ